MFYSAARAVWSERAALFSGWVACMTPSLLFWSAMSQKECWIVLGTAMTLRGICDWGAQHKGRGLLWVVGGILLASSSRTYLRPLLALPTLLSFIGWRAARPALTIVVMVSALCFVLVMGNGLGVLHLDIAGFVQQRLQETRDYGTSQAAGAETGVQGLRSGIMFHYDVRTPGGLAMMLLMGGTYCLFSPFPWQMSGRQFAVLPELLAWWALLAFFIVPGLLHGWRTNRRLLLCALLYLGRSSSSIPSHSATSS
jgi:hypothetical protein